MELTSSGRFWTSPSLADDSAPISVLAQLFPMARAVLWTCLRPSTPDRAYSVVWVVWIAARPTLRPT